MKMVRRFPVAVTIPIAFAITSCFAAGCAEPSVEPMPVLHAQGRVILDADNNQVVLRGVNLGGWLFNETWITQIDYALLSRVHVLAQGETFAATVDELLATKSDEWQGATFLQELEAALAAEIGATAAAAFVNRVEPYAATVYDDSDLPLRRKLSERFGDDARDELLDIFQDAWLTEDDIAWIAAQGFNLVRVPMSYRNLVTGPDLDRPTALNFNERAWTRLDRLLYWCEKHRVYAVLDIQEAPGGQNDYNGVCLLYDDPSLQELTVRLWTEIATRFGGHSAVAAYSLLAEPFGAPDADARDAMYDKLYRAIRALGDNHLLIIHDGFLGMQTMPLPSKFGWENVVYSTHIFEFSAQSYEDYDFLVNYLHDTIFTEAQSKQEVPYYIGSFSTRFDVDWAYDAARLLVDWYTERNWSWSVWTYKRIDDPIAFELLGKTSSYGVRTLHTGPFDRPDVFDDDLPTLRRKMAAYRDLVLDPNPRLLEILTSVF